MNRLPILAVFCIVCAPAHGAAEVRDNAAEWAPPESGVVWRLSSDGDWLAAVPRALDSATQGPSAGARVVRGPVSPANLAMPWCRDARGVLAIGALAADCAREQLLSSSAVGSPLPGGVGAAQAGVSGPRWQFGLSFRHLESSPLAAVLPLHATLEPGARLMSPALDAYVEGMGRELGLGSTWQIGPTTRLNLGASAAETAWRPLRGGRVDVESIAVQFGLELGSFSGALVGRVLRPAPLAGATVDHYATGLDIGVAWRAPWRAELSIGAQNLIGAHGQTGNAQPVIDQITARTPYVRYTQDL